MSCLYCFNVLFCCCCVPLYGDCLSNIDKGHYVINWIHESLYILFFLQASYFLLFIVISKGERQIVGDTVHVLSYWSSEYYCDQYFSAHRLKGCFHTNLRTDACLISGLSKRVFLIHEGSSVWFLLVVLHRTSRHSISFT